MSTSGEAYGFGRLIERPLPAGLGALSESIAGEAVAELLAGVRADTAEIGRMEARRLARISELYARREQATTARADGAGAMRFIDDWDLLTAEVGAALGTTRGPAATAVHRAVDLRERLPEVFDLYARGTITSVHAFAAVRASAAIVDERICAEFDRRLAAVLARRLINPAVVMSPRAVGEAAGRILAALDPEAAPQDPPPNPTPRLLFTGLGSGMVAMEGLLSKPDAIRVSALCDEIAQTVCRKDGRSLAERRMAGLVTLVEGYQTLGCRCGATDCEFLAAQPRTGAVAQDIKALAVIVLNETDYGGAAAGPDGAAPAASGAAFLVTETPDLGGPIPAEQARALIEDCDTRITTLGRRHPDGTVHATGASGYRPTEYQLLVMRLTYPTCMFPACTVPASRCQADHVWEYDAAEPATGGRTTVAGANTGPGNLVPLCPFHHRIKSESGWLSDVLPDGTVEWRHPAGGIWIVDPGTTSIPGLNTLVWDVRHPDPTGTADPNALDTGARRRNRERQRLRDHYRRLREEKEHRLARARITAGAAHAPGGTGPPRAGTVDLDAPPF